MAYNKMKKNFQENYVNLHVDYSQSYNNTQKEEIKSAYLVNSTFTSFTTCSYILDHRKEFSTSHVAAVSKCNDRARTVTLTRVGYGFKRN